MLIQKIFRLISYKSVNILYHDIAREGLLKGIRTVNRAVQSTLGPRVIFIQGLNVAIDYELGKPKITKDGVTVAKHIEFRNTLQDLGGKLIKFSADETNKSAGDGTTTTTMLASYMLEEGVKACRKGYNPIDVKKGIELAGAVVQDYLTERAIPITSQEEIFQLALIATNHDEEFSNLITEAIIKTGRSGIINIEESTSNDNKLLVTFSQFSDGFIVNRGFASPEFLTDLTQIDVKLENPYIVLLGFNFHEFKPIVKLLKQIKEQGRSMLVIAVDIDHDALEGLLLNVRKEEISGCGINVPGNNDWNIDLIKDIASFTGGKVCYTDWELEQTQLSELGTSRRVTIEEHTTTFFEGAGDTTERIEFLRQQYQESKLDEELNVLKERIQRLSGKMGIIEIGLQGGQFEINEKRDRIVDALNTVKTGLKEGILPGGGTALLHAAKRLKPLCVKEEYQIGFRIVRDALMQPLTQLSMFSPMGITAVDQVWDQENEDVGLDVNQGKLTDMFQSGIIDSAHIVKSSLSHAVSVAAMILSTNVTVCRIRKYEPPKLDTYPKKPF